MPDRSVFDIASDLLSQFPVLIRQEIQLARAELSEKINRISSGLIVLVLGAVVSIPALVILLQAAVYGLESAGLTDWAAALIAGGAALVFALIAFAIGIGMVRATKLMPERTIRQIQQDATIAKRQMKAPSHDFQRAA